MKKIGLLLLMIGAFQLVSAQYFTTGSDPASIKWRQINSPNFQIIYPDDFEGQAKRFASMLEQAYELGYQSLGTAPQKISVVIHAHSLTSNGMVATAPRRMEIYPTPHQDIYAQEWLAQLATHEYRHVVQVDKIAQEMPKILHLLFGEQAAAALLGAYLPFWFMEGDAVVAETALSYGGRGRNPAFLMESKAQLLEQGAVSYDKITMGSYRDYIPNRYAFGWWFVGGIRAKYGADVWEKVLHRVARKPLSLNPVNKALKDISGQRKEELYVQLWEGYRKQWQGEVDQLRLTDYKPYSSQLSGSYINYLYVDHLADGSVVALRKSREDMARIVRLKGEEPEEVVYTPGWVVIGSFSAQENQLIWSEARPHLRWTHADRSKIIIYDTENKQKKVFDSKANLSSPVLSPKLDQFMAVAASWQGKYEIQLFSSKDGALLRRIALPNNDYIISPTWSSSAEEIYFIGLGAKGKYLGSIRLDNQQITSLTSPVYYDMRNLSYHKNKLLFTSAKTGVDNIFSFDLSSQELVQLTESKFGADYGSVHENNLDYADYHSTGYQLVRSSVSDWKRQAHRDTQITVSNPLAAALAAQEKGLISFAELDTAQVETEKYAKLPHAINIHSWMPLVADVDNSAASPGISFLSQNKLGTAVADFGYQYDWAEERGKVYANYQYLGWFPTMKLSTSYGGRRVNYLAYTAAQEIVNAQAQWNELKLSATLGVPLTFSSGKYTQSLQPSINYSMVKAFRTQGYDPQLLNYRALNYQLYLANSLRRAELDLQSKWAQNIKFNYISSFKQLNDLGEQFSVASNLYFPGIFKHDGFKFSAAYQWRDKERLSRFNDFIPLARGYASRSSKEMSTLAANYTFPLCYPDWSLRRVFFFQRIRGNLFYDYSRYLSEGIGGSNLSSKRNTTINLQSYGVELHADGYFFRLPTPMSFGVRTMYLPTVKSFGAEFLFSVDVYGI